MSPRTALLILALLAPLLPAVSVSAPSAQGLANRAEPDQGPGNNNGEGPGSNNGQGPGSNNGQGPGSNNGNGPGNLPPVVTPPAPPSPPAPPGHVAHPKGPVDQDAALEAVERREALPLETIRGIAEKATGARVIDASLVRSGRFLIYRLTTVDSAGLVSRSFWYARTGKPVGKN